jgi:paraquat-inducible protein B
MAKETSKTVIGIFVISAIALIMGGVVVFGSGKFFKKTQKYVLFFGGSVKGLSDGSPVVWRGVKIGTVDMIILLGDPKAMTVEIPVIIEIERERFQMKGERTEKIKPKERMAQLIEHGLRAKLTIQSPVTGQLMIDLDFHPNTTANLIGSDYPYPEIPTIPSTLEQIAETLSELPIKKMFKKLEDAIENVSNVLGDPALKEIVASAKGVVENANRLIKDTDKLIANVDRQVTPIADSVINTAEDAQQLIRNINGHVDPVASKVDAALDEAKAALIQAGKTMEGIEALTAEDSETNYRLNKALSELTRVARSVRVLTDYLEQYPDSPLRGKGGSGGK